MLFSKLTFAFDEESHPKFNSLYFLCTWNSYSIFDKNFLRLRCLKMKCVPFVCFCEWIWECPICLSLMLMLIVYVGKQSGDAYSFYDCYYFFVLLTHWTRLLNDSNWFAWLFINTFYRSYAISIEMMNERSNEWFIKVADVTDGNKSKQN